jgi:hypothetical protein
VKGGPFAVNQEPRGHGYPSVSQVVSRNLRRVRFADIIEEIKEEIITSLTNDSPSQASEHCARARHTSEWPDSPVA